MKQNKKVKTKFKKQTTQEGLLNVYIFVLNKQPVGHREWADKKEY